MPIYEYQCRACRHQFERLVRQTSAGPEAAIDCPSCRSQEVERLLSLFAVSSDGTSQQHLKQARKLGEKDRRDRKHADREAIIHHDD
jgi:putative FmdB family regulatory protein